MFYAQLSSICLLPDLRAHNKLSRLRRAVFTITSQSSARCYSQWQLESRENTAFVSTHGILAFILHPKSPMFLLANEASPSPGVNVPGDFEYSINLFNIPHRLNSVFSSHLRSSTSMLLQQPFQHSPSEIPARVSFTCFAVSWCPFHFLLSGCMPAHSSLVNVPNQLLNISEASITWSSNQKVWSMPQGPQSVNFSSSLPCKPSARCQPSYYLWRMPQCFHAVYWHWSTSSIAFEPSFNLKLESLLRCPR